MSNLGTIKNLWDNLYVKQNHVIMVKVEEPTLTIRKSIMTINVYVKVYMKPGKGYPSVLEYSPATLTFTSNEWRDLTPAQREDRKEYLKSKSNRFCSDLVKRLNG